MPQATDQGIGPGQAIEEIIAIAAIEQVRLGAPLQAVVAIQTVDPVGSAGRSGDRVIASAAADGSEAGADAGRIPDGAVREAEALELVGGREKLILDGHPIGCAEQDHQVVVGAQGIRDIGSPEIGELQGIDMTRREVTIGDHVGPVTTCEDIGIATSFPAQCVLARTAGQRIGPGPPIEDVVTGTTQQEVIPPQTVEQIVAVAAVEQVRERATAQGVVAIKAGDAVGGILQTGNHVVAGGRSVGEQSRTNVVGCPNRR